MSLKISFKDRGGAELLAMQAFANYVSDSTDTELYLMLTSSVLGRMPYANMPCLSPYLSEEDLDSIERNAEGQKE